MMKVKANYSIRCDKGDFRTGDIFEIKACDLPMYGDAVAVVENDIPAAPVAPEVKEEVQEKPVAKKPAAEEAVQEKPKATRAKSTGTRSRKVSEAQ